MFLNCPTVKSKLKGPASYYPTALGLTCGKNATRAVRRNERDVDHPGAAVELLKIDFN